jgi:hypothetical protein
VLTSTFDDNSYVRQKLSYDLWAALAASADRPRLAPRTFFAVVYLNAEYHGLYVAVDRIDDEFVEQMGLDGDGELFKAVEHTANWDDVDGAACRRRTSRRAGRRRRASSSRTRTRTRTMRPRTPSSRPSGT